MDICTEKSCCFTGHRMEKLLGTEEHIRSGLRREIKAAIDLGYDTFITGMATGVDTWAALEVLKFKESNKNIKLVCAIPFKGVELNRTAEQIAEFNSILEKSDDAVYIAPKYKRWCFYARNEWMVNHSKRLIAVFNGSHSGTEFTINFAKKNGREVVMLIDN